MFFIYYGPWRGNAASKQIEISRFIVFLRMKQINSGDSTIGLINLEASKRSQHDPHETNNFYGGFLPNEANGEIYLTFNISVLTLLAPCLLISKYMKHERRGLWVMSNHPRNPLRICPIFDRLWICDTLFHGLGIFRWYHMKGKLQFYIFKYHGYLPHWRTMR